MGILKRCTLQQVFIYRKVAVFVCGESETHYPCTRSEDYHFYSILRLLSRAHPRLVLSLVHTGSFRFGSELWRCKSNQLSLTFRLTVLPWLFFISFKRTYRGGHCLQYPEPIIHEGRRVAFDLDLAISHLLTSIDDFPFLLHGNTESYDSEHNASA